MTSIEIIAAGRESVLRAYLSAEADNRLRFLQGDEKATSEYIYENQIIDANAIVEEFYTYNRRVVSVTKKTKVGMDGLMIEVAKLMTTHPDDSFVVNPANVRIITGMSNAGWEKDMKEKSPICFKDKIFHHGKLRHAELIDLRDALIIIDEIDTGDKEYQVLHNTLKDAGILNVTYMEEHNIRFMFASATMVKELYNLYQWGELHKWYKMTIPDNYIGHIDFLQMGIIKEFYPLTTPESADKWIREDVCEHYGTDFRVHIVRVTNKNVGILQDACIRKRITFRNHTSTDRMRPEDIKEIFTEPLQGHIVVGVKGFFRRANLIPNKWKLRIGATHELYTKTVDNNVQIQGLPGRISGYWRDVIDGGHKTGPHRTSIRAVTEYETVFNDPFGDNSYRTTGFVKKDGRITTNTPTMVSVRNVEGIVPVELPRPVESPVDINTYRIYASEEITKKVCRILGYTYRATQANAAGFKETSLNARKGVASLTDAVNKIRSGYGGGAEGAHVYRTYYPCYVDTTDNSTIRYVVIIRPDTDVAKLQTVDTTYPSIPL
jgi:hypothetical protein